VSSGSERLSAEEVGNFAVDKLEAWRAAEPTDSQIVNAAKRFVGRLHTYALQNEITPPEAAFFELDPKSRAAATTILTKGAEINLKAAYMNSDAARRIVRILEYSEDPIDTDSSPYLEDDEYEEDTEPLNQGPEPSEASTFGYIEASRLVLADLNRRMQLS